MEIKWWLYLSILIIIFLSIPLFISYTLGGRLIRFIHFVESWTRLMNSKDHVKIYSANNDLLFFQQRDGLFCSTWWMFYYVRVRWLQTLFPDYNLAWATFTISLRLYLSLMINFAGPLYPTLKLLHKCQCDNFKILNRFTLVYDFSQDDNSLRYH